MTWDCQGVVALLVVPRMNDNDLPNCFYFVPCFVEATCNRLYPRVVGVVTRVHGIVAIVSDRSVSVQGIAPQNLPNYR
jgi:hypothetical protein